MSELLPCPFCGGEAEAREQGGVTYITCLSCFAQTLGKYGKQRAIADWNTRAERTCRNDNGWCSECEHYLHDGFKWCPWCGAKVVGE